MSGGAKGGNNDCRTSFDHQRTRYTRLPFSGLAILGTD